MNRKGLIKRSGIRSVNKNTSDRVLSCKQAGLYVRATQPYPWR